MTTCIILVWVYGSDPYEEPPADIFGPFTEAEAKRITSTLLCHHRIQRVTTRIPEWATT